MSENCDKNCSDCGDERAERKEDRTDFSEKPHEQSDIKKVIAVISGKGGVGKN